MEEGVVVMTPRRDPPEGLLLGEFVVERAPPGVGGRRWRRAVHGVPVVQGEVARFGFERYPREIALLAPAQPMFGVPVRPRKHHQLAVCGVCVVELYPCLDQRAHDGVAADAIMDMPTEVAISFDNTRVL